MDKIPQPMKDLIATWNRSVGWPGSAARAHLELVGHPLEEGCCAAELARDDERQEDEAA